MKRTLNLNSTNNSASSNHVSSTNSNSSATVQNTASDGTRALDATKAFNIFTSAPDIILRVLYACDFETLCTFRLLTQQIYSLSMRCCEANPLSPLALKAMIAINLMEFINYRKTDKFIFAKEWASSYVDINNIRGWLHHIDQLHDRREDPSQTLSVLKQELELLAQANRLIIHYDYEKWDLESINEFISTNNFLDQKTSILKCNTKLKHIINLSKLSSPINCKESSIGLIVPDIALLNNFLLTNEFSDDQTLILRNITYLNIRIDDNKLKELASLTNILSEPNTPLSQLRSLSLNIAEEVDFTLTESNCPSNITGIHFYNTAGISLRVSELPKLRRFHLFQLFNGDTVILENLPNLVEIRIDRQEEKHLSGSLTLKNLPILTSLIIEDKIADEAYLSLENVPNLKALKIKELPRKGIFESYFLNITALELDFLNAKGDLTRLQGMTNLKELILINSVDFDSHEFPDPLSIEKLTNLEKLQIGDFSDSNFINTEFSIEDLDNLITLDLPNIGRSADLNLSHLGKLKTLRIGHIFHNNIFGCTLRSDGEQMLYLPELEILSLGNINAMSTTRHLEFLSEGCLPKLKKLSFGDINAVTNLPKNLSKTIEELSFGNINAQLRLPKLPENVKLNTGEINTPIQYHPSDPK